MDNSINSSISFAGHYANTNQSNTNSETTATPNGRENQKTLDNSPKEAEKNSAAQVSLSSKEEQQVAHLERRDNEVRRHEAAHKAAGGNLTGAVQYTYTMGPNSKLYASGGEVSIDTSSVPGDPLATLAKAQKIRQAALAPAAPSAQDQQVAAQAAQMEAEARTQLSAEQPRTLNTGTEKSNTEEEKSEQETLPNTQMNRRRLNHSYVALSQPSTKGVDLLA